MGVRDFRSRPELLEGDVELEGLLEELELAGVLIEELTGVLESVLNGGGPELLELLDCEWGVLNPLL